MVQVDNDHGPFSQAFGAAGQEAYMNWDVNMAVGMRTGVPWVVGKQDDAPDSVVSNISSGVLEMGVVISY